eukprot:TRINITY_DN4983_c0_g1_i1.p1 TRINITY_DN4983_c0_g1~~TRINITY_DN4983_c0_g1_i1.p1  ORF type:complete len:462 (-),score=59.13 TRINITY_DN4983_c0_g1_i1:263-1648(-)
MFTVCRILTLFPTLAVASSAACDSKPNIAKSPILMQSLLNSRSTDRTATGTFLVKQESAKGLPLVRDMFNEAWSQFGEPRAYSSKDTAANDIAAETASQHSAVNAEPPRTMRPSLQRGQPDFVNFSISVKKWYGIDFAQSAFDVDAVVTLQWFDLRAAQLLPPNSTSTSLSTERARAQIWLPDIVFTNAAHKGYDTISSSVRIEANGTVTKVERSYLTLKQPYQTGEFPFDSQDVSIMLASSTYMNDELQLVPVTERLKWGTQRDLFNNSVWSFVNASLTSFNDDDGMLKKSRGVLTLRLQRSPSQYMSSIFIPSVVLLVMTWTAFWLPLGPPFAMPRIAVNAFGLLCQVSVSTAANGLVPATGKTSLMIEYIELCIELQFMATLINVIILGMEQRKGGSALAAYCNDVMIKVFPFSIVLNLCVLMAGKTASRCTVAATMIGYVSWLTWTYENKQDAEADK